MKSIILASVWRQFGVRLGSFFGMKKKLPEIMTFLSGGGGRRPLKPPNKEIQMGKVAQITRLETV